ncbi:MAG TPA: DNA gyrase inhibitor YacG [Acidobacteriota bacterium]|nr:DNA gyrase inhibitor YacG [Acidobacteriota bacterium]
MNVKCPRCGKETAFQDNPFRPFCSERCKLIDLGNWLSQTYRAPTRSSDEEEDGVTKPPTESNDA